MNLQQIGQDIFISAQINIEDIQTLAKTGFKTIICNRPDREDPHQLDFPIIKTVAQKYGMKAYHIPIISSVIEPSDIRAMQTILKTAPLPILAYCRSGTRSMHLYRLAHI
ncbi:TIGR01244 family sulfur transferase [Bartonella sp. A05]|uniref:TIGR01244 family sulfur transferase n=1 Tax=Bartonella sp. A05 TaxID=2967261 RepID=UPI0022A9F0EB|nr:TIGR01244 family sulfur transferase [Bartonella sp. A05]MCZ2203282.1 TIGR01244 family sulfur transferase [Bartonella sp. A05]